MSGPRLTDEQRSIVTRGDGDAVVLAGAGSGKTTVLSQRFAHLVEARGLSPRDIAALTFTDRAASEMRSRIGRALARSGDPAVRARAPEVEFAPVATIHAFCARLLHEHAIEAGVDPAFALADEVEARLLLEQSFEVVLRGILRGGADSDRRRSALRRLGGDTVGRTITALHETLRGLGFEPGRARLATGLTSAADALADVDRALEDLDAAATGPNGSPPPPDLADAFQAVRRAFPSADALRAAGSDGGFLAAAAAAARFPPRLYVKARDALLEAYEAAAGALLDVFAHEDVEKPLRAILADLSAAYTAKKRERGVLDFIDLEARAAALLADLDHRGLPLPGRPRALLVDEYQDLNRVQARLLGHLRQPARGARVDQFAVGDPKQSIYRFRRADVSVMTHEFEAAGERGRARLRESFRSRADLVAFHNALFSRLVTEDAAGIAYEPLVARAEFRDADRAIPPEFVLVDATTSPSERSLAEARVIAATIERWVGRETRTKVERGPDGGTAPPRALRYGDVAVLLRSRGSLKSIERALLDAGIPFHVGRGMGFYDAPEVRDLIHLLRAVHDPLDRFALAAHLASPAVGATDADLVAAFAGAADPMATLRATPALAPCAARIERLRHTAAAGSLEEVVREAIDGVDAAATSLLQPGGARRARNLAKAVEFARRLDDEGGHGLFDLLRVLAGLVAREIDEAEAASGVEGDAVSILTVHGAKGLQWPCVILADTNRKEPTSRDAWLLDDEGRVGLRLRDPLEGVERSTGAYDACKAAEADAQRRESRRLLYVAMTRAEERLVVTASASERTKDGRPSRIAGWAKDLYEALGGSFDLGRRQEALDGAPYVLSVVPPPPRPSDAPTAPLFLRLGPQGVLVSPAHRVTDRLEREARAQWARVEQRPASLGATPFVASISDLLAFARSPAAFYEERVVGSDDAMPAAALSGESDDPFSAATEGVGDAAAARGERAGLWDEGRERVDGVDRAALGRAVHHAIERWSPEAGDLDTLVRQAVADEPAFDGVGAVRDGRVLLLARGMVDRLLASSTGRALDAALRRGAGVRREVAFHARIRFPDGHRVAGLDSLLLRGSIDLLLEDADGAVRLYDHKTNAPGERLADAASVVARYETQLRLYALAAERLFERDVARAALLLLDPAWAARGAPVEAEVDISGPALAQARSLCRAFATALLEDRFPSRWQDLLAT